MNQNILPDFEETTDQRNFRQKYMSAINKAYKYDESIGIMDIGEDKKISLQDIYVPLRFSKHENEESFFTKTKTESLIELFSKSHNIVLSGKPGCGKTTLSRFIINALSSYELSPIATNFGRKLPLYIKLRDYKIEDINSFDNFFDSYIDMISSILKFDINRDYIEFYLKNGWCFLLFDGVDEVGNEDNRFKIRNYILKNFSKYNDKNYILVTSRPTGIESSYFFEYTKQEEKETFKELHKELVFEQKESFENFKSNDELIDKEINFPKYNNKSKLSFPSLYYVSQFNDEQINIYSNNWFKLREENPKVIKDKVDDFISSIDKIKNLTILKRRPVFLSMMIHIHTTKGKLPYSRAMAYKYMVEAYIEHIDIARRLNKFYSKDWSFEDKVRVLEELAYRLHSASINSETNYKSSVQITLNKEQLKETIQRIIEDNIEKWQTVERGDENELLEFYISRTGLLHEPEENKIQFSHLSFQEYLTAHSIFKKVIEHPFEIKDRIENEILNRLNDPKWNEVILIFFSLYKDATDSILKQFKNQYKNNYKYFELVLTLSDSIEYGIQDSHLDFWLESIIEYFSVHKEIKSEDENVNNNESKLYNLVDKLFRNNRINLSTIGEKSSQYLGTRFSDEVNLENIGYLISYNENICKKNKELILKNFDKFLDKRYFALCEIFAVDFPSLCKRISEKYDLSKLVLYYDNISYSGKKLFLSKDNNSWKSKYLKYHWMIINVFASVVFTKISEKSTSYTLDKFLELNKIKYEKINNSWLNIWKSNIWHEHRNGKSINLDYNFLFSHFEYFYKNNNNNNKYYSENNELNEELKIFTKDKKLDFVLRDIMIIFYSNNKVQNKYEFDFLNKWDNYNNFKEFATIFLDPSLLHKYLEKELSVEIDKESFILEVEEYYNESYSIKNEIKFILNNEKFFNILTYTEFKNNLIKAI